MGWDAILQSSLVIADCSPRLRVSEEAREMAGRPNGVAAVDGRQRQSAVGADKVSRGPGN
jgi:hypothetical protein